MMPRFYLILVGAVFLSGISQNGIAQGQSDFHQPDSVAARYAGYEVTRLKELSDLLTEPFIEEEEQFRAIFKWVCENIRNDYNLYALNKAKRGKLYNRPEELWEWNTKFNQKVMDRLVKSHETVCTGYAYLIKELSYHAGLSSEIINGYGRTAQSIVSTFGNPNHSWNAVKLNGHWQLCDATWSSGVIDAEEKRFVSDFSDAYFLTDPELFVLNHYPSDSVWMLVDEQPTLTEFSNKPFVYKPAFTYDLHPQAPRSLEMEIRKGDTLVFAFESSFDFSDHVIELEVVKGNSSTSFEPQMELTTTGFRFDHQFSSSGRRVAHVKVDGKYVVTYKVDIVK